MIWTELYIFTGDGDVIFEEFPFVGEPLVGDEITVDLEFRPGESDVFHCCISSRTHSALGADGNGNNGDPTLTVYAALPPDEEKRFNDLRRRKPKTKKKS